MIVYFFNKSKGAFKKSMSLITSTKGRTRKHSHKQSTRTKKATKKRTSIDLDLEHEEEQVQEPAKKKAVVEDSGSANRFSWLALAGGLVMICDASIALTGLDEKRLCANIFGPSYSNYLECVNVANKILVPQQFAMHTVAWASSWAAKGIAYAMSAQGVARIFRK